MKYSTNEIIFLFGAGAELNFKIKNGYKYTIDSIITKKEDLYKELKMLYSKSNFKYKAVFRFNKKSNSLSSLILDTYKGVDKKKLKINVLEIRGLPIRNE